MLLRSKNVKKTSFFRVLGCRHNLRYDILILVKVVLFMEKQFIIRNISFILTFVIILVWYLIHMKYVRNKKFKKVAYVRDIPSGLEPELLQTIYYGRVCKNALWITLLNLIKLGVYRIEKTVNSEGKEIKKIKFIKKIEGLNEHQIQVITIINGLMKDNLIKDNTIDVTLVKKELNNKPVHYDVKKHKFISYESFEKELLERKQKLFKKNKKGLKYIVITLYIFMFILIGFISLLANILYNTKIAIAIFALFSISTILCICVFIKMNNENNDFGFKILLIFLTATLFPFLADIHTMYIPYVLLLYIIKRAHKIERKSKEEIKIQEEIEGLRRYIKDYSMLEDKDLEHITLWEDYLIMAIALKLNKKVINFYYEYCNEIFDKSVDDIYLDMLLFFLE